MKQHRPGRSTWATETWSDFFARKSPLSTTVGPPKLVLQIRELHLCHTATVLRTRDAQSREREGLIPRVCDLLPSRPLVPLRPLILNRPLDNAGLEPAHDRMDQTWDFAPAFTTRAFSASSFTLPRFQKLALNESRLALPQDLPRRPGPICEHAADAFTASRLQRVSVLRPCRLSMSS